MNGLHLQGIGTAGVPSGLKLRSWRWHYKGSESLHHGNVVNVVALVCPIQLPLKAAIHEFFHLFHLDLAPSWDRNGIGKGIITPEGTGCKASFFQQFWLRRFPKALRSKFRTFHIGPKKKLLKSSNFWPTMRSGVPIYPSHMRDPKCLAWDWLLAAAVELVRGLLAGHHVPLRGAWEAPEHCRNDTETATKHHSNLFTLTSFWKKA